MAKSFHIGDVLTITTGRLIAPRHIEAVYDLLGYMTDDSPMTHQLLRLADECRPELLRQHPDLAAVELPERIDQDNIGAVLVEFVERYGETREVTPLEPGVHKYRDPVEEACDLIGPEKVWVARTEEGER